MVVVTLAVPASVVILTCDVVKMLLYAAKDCANNLDHYSQLSQLFLHHWLVDKISYWPAKKTDTSEGLFSYTWLMDSSGSDVHGHGFM